MDGGDSFPCCTYCLGRSDSIHVSMYCIQSFVSIIIIYHVSRTPMRATQASGSDGT